MFTLNMPYAVTYTLVFGHDWFHCLSTRINIKVTKQSVNLIGFASRQLENNDSIRAYTVLYSGFFSFWQTNVPENKPDLHTILHV